MSATDELRRLLDERGVEWSTNETLTDCWTRWDADKFRCTATEINGVFAFTVGNSTPEQAIAATLGSGTCHVKAAEKIRDLFGFSLSCGHSMVNLFDDHPDYCPWCGAKVVEA